MNLQGGVGNNIPNDNMVELYVGVIKRRLKAQGANMTFRSAQVATDTIQVHQVMQEQVVQDSKARQTSRSRPDVQKQKDLEVMAKHLLEAGYFEHHCNRQSPNFRNFVSPLQRVNVSRLCQWLQDNKERAAVEMVHASYL